MATRLNPSLTFRDTVMHSMLTTDHGLALMGADTPNTMEYATGSNYSVSLSGEDDAELRGSWDKLTVGATIAEPLSTAPWGDSFGMFTDKSGVSWLVNIAGSQPQVACPGEAVPA